MWRQSGGEKNRDRIAAFAPSRSLAGRSRNPGGDDEWDHRWRL